MTTANGRLSAILLIAAVFYALTALFPVHAAADITHGLVGWWKFDDCARFFWRRNYRHVLGGDVGDRQARERAFVRRQHQLCKHKQSGKQDPDLLVLRGVMVQAVSHDQRGQSGRGSDPVQSWRLLFV
jgi:hypothetical protein